MTKKQLKVHIITMLPGEWSYAEKLSFFEDLAAMYRKKSQLDVSSDERKFRAKIGKKNIDYTPVLKNK